MAGEAARRAGGFQLGQKLAEGGMAIVWEATAPDGTPAVVKILRDVMTTEDGLRRFEREASIRLDHPNVVRVLDAGRDENNAPWIAFERLEGKTLRELVDERPLTAAESVDAMVQACRGLAAAHDVGVIHRDVKPSNIFVCEDGTVKMLDFGVAFLAQGQERVTLDRSVLVGTPAYLSPEQARGEIDLDARTDVWALGVILYELLAGRRPFLGDAPLATLLAVTIDTAPPISALVAGMPRALSDVVACCLEKERDDRFSTMRMLEAALESLEQAPLAAVRAPARREIDHEADTRETRPPPTPTANRTTMGENRVVALLLAEAVRDGKHFDSVVRAYGGRPVPIMGNRAIGLFGGVSWKGDEITNAARAALEARGVVGRIALASGRAALRGVRVSGEVVREAQEACRVDVKGVAVHERTAEALPPELVHRPADGSIVELVTEERASMPAPTMDTPLVGRDVELARLERTADEALARREPRVALLVGPPGVGRTRLLRELAQRLQDRGVATLAARAHALKRERALSLFATFLRDRADQEGEFRLEPSAPIEERRSAVRALAALGTTSKANEEQAVEVLGQLLDVPMLGGTLASMARSAPRLVADRVHATCADWVEVLARRAPLALLIDDVHHADPDTLSLLEELLDRLGDVGVILVAAARPELARLHPDLFADFLPERVELSGLGPEDVGSLAAHVAGRDVPGVLARTLIERTEGNPLFVEQMVRVLSANDQLDTETSRDLLPLPLSVEAAVQSRLDHLPAAEKELLKTVSILQRGFLEDEVAALGLPGARNLLGSLRRRELLAAGRPHRRGDRIYRFRSSLVGDVARRMLADDARKALHGRAAEMLAERPETDPEEVARHFEEAGRRGEAGEFWARAAKTADARFDAPSALELSERAFDCGAPEADLFELHRIRADALAFDERQTERMAEAEAMLAHADTADQRAHAYGRMAAALVRQGRMDEATMYAQRALDEARISGDTAAVVQALCRFINAVQFTSRMDEAEAALAEAESMVDGLPPWIEARVVASRAALGSSTGDVGARVEYYQQAARLYEQVGDHRSAARCEVNIADAYNRVGAFEDAVRANQAALETLRRIGSNTGYALMNLGYAQLMLDRIAEAEKAFAEAEAVAHRAEDPRLRTFVGIYRARARLRAGRTDAAIDLARRAADVADERRMVTLSIHARTIEAEALLAAGDPAAALERSSVAIDLLRGPGAAEEDEAHLWLAHADALRALGREADADAALAEGRERLEDTISRVSDPDWRTRLAELPAHQRLLGDDS